MPIYEYKCNTCGRIFDLLLRPQTKSEPQCKHCDSDDLKRLISRPGLIRSQGAASGELRPVDPRRAVENMSRTYDRSGIDPGEGFSEVAKRAARGDSPETLKEAVKEAKQKEAQKSRQAADKSSDS